jgi:multidrug resistance efflux pump
MAGTSVETDFDSKHSEEIQDIITKVPSWLLRWGLTLVFFVVAIIIVLSVFIRYPDVIKTQLIITSSDAPKPVLTKISGKLIRILVKENEEVTAGQTLAFLESTAEHTEVLQLLKDLKKLQSGISNGNVMAEIKITRSELNLGELQGAYQTFNQSYMTYRAALSHGLYATKLSYLQSDIKDINNQKQQLIQQKEIQSRDYELALDEYNMHKKLRVENVETVSELRQAESKYLSKKSPLLQTEQALINSSTAYSAKEKEILELRNQIVDERGRFAQALYSLISQIDEWKNRYVLTAPQSGRLSYVNFIQQNQPLSSNEIVFYVNPGSEKFFGEMKIPQVNMGKVRIGQRVIIKLHSYPFEEYGILNGRIKEVSEIPGNDSSFLSQVSLTVKTSSGLKKMIHLKQGMIADAEIVTQDVSLFQRISRNLIKSINNSD